MNFRLLALPFIIALSAPGAHAADLLIEPAPAATVDAGTAFYVQGLGGGVGGGDMSFFDPTEESYDMQAGYALAIALGYQLVDGIALEADILHSKRAFTYYPDDDQTNTSLMANLKGQVRLNETFGVYGAVGAGYILSTNTHSNGDSYDYGGLGYQLIGGISVDMGNGIELLAEGRYQNGFDDLESLDGETYVVEGQTTTGLVGIKFGF